MVSYKRQPRFLETPKYHTPSDYTHHYSECGNCGNLKKVEKCIADMLLLELYMLFLTKPTIIIVLSFCFLCHFYYLCIQNQCDYLQWPKDTINESRTSAKLSQPALAESLGVHFRTVQNWGKGTIPIPASVSQALESSLVSLKMQYIEKRMTKQQLHLTKLLSLTKS